MKRNMTAQQYIISKLVLQPKENLLDAKGTIIKKVIGSFNVHFCLGK